MQQYPPLHTCTGEVDALNLERALAIQKTYKIDSRSKSLETSSELQERRTHTLSELANCHQCYIRRVMKKVEVIETYLFL